jgi:ornithine cyclodeaminase/alanine dehydrogenase-like protein (mu-crystallin family)
MTRVLTRTDLAAVLDVTASLDALREGFRNAASIPGGAGRYRADLPFPGTAAVLFPGLLPGIGAYTVKVNAKFPAARPALRGIVCLHAGADGELLALIDSAGLTSWRTGLAAALGTDLLARPQPAGGDVLGVIGAGAQNTTVVRGLDALRRRRELLVHDIDADRSADFARRHGGTDVATTAEIAALADIIIAATWARSPVLEAADLRPGQHVTSLGSDEPGKQELSTQLLAESILIVDDRDLAASTGALASAGLPGSAAAATLTEVLSGEQAGRTSPRDRTVYAPVGLPWQDLAIAWIAYQRAERDDVGTRLDLLS